ncbi:hypothetical protein [Wenjunlia tyrosinilytica]|uniref:Uncharacterized protein n=1 Tax=Wenjunlia tyrosinilytica TaxID=1544741 RepID=A0A917ZWP5_9ACTN|nr:hypothetical protein [Wenjunlia tyrosinilytica]GGO98105.1 hypothetical protein GCM10012280_61460 [Wenjunlia tyrosinilytica]
MPQSTDLTGLRKYIQDHTPYVAEAEEGNSLTVGRPSSVPEGSYLVRKEGSAFVFYRYGQRIGSAPTTLPAAEITKKFLEAVART